MLADDTLDAVHQNAESLCWLWTLPIRMPSHDVGCGRCPLECGVIVLVVDAVHQNAESLYWLWTLPIRMPSHRVGCGRCPLEC